MKDFKIVFVTAGLPYLGLPDLVKFAQKNGFQGLDLACWPKYMVGGRYVASHLNLDSILIDRNEAKKILKLMKKNKLETSALTFNDNILDENPAKRTFYQAHLKKIIEIAPLLNVKVVVTFVGRNFSKSIEENIDEFRWIFPQLVKFAKDYGVKIAIENCPINNICHTPRMWKLLSKLIPEKDRDYFGLCLDPSHLIWQDIDYIRAVYEFKDMIFHVHAKDVEIDKENLFWDGNLGKVSRYITRLPGDGDIDWKAFFKALRDINYQGAISIEPEDPRFECPEDSIKNQKLVMEGLKKSQKFLSPFCYKGGKYEKNKRRSNWRGPNWKTSR